MFNNKEKNIIINGRIICEICSDYSDGNHYDIQACRSCTAFFRRTISFNKKYNCSADNNCIINYKNRNTCKECRYKKCLDKGMNISSVQPRREPTGAQLNRRNRRNSINNSIMKTIIKSDIKTNNNISFDDNIKKENISNSTIINDNLKEKENCNNNFNNNSDIFSGFINSYNIIECKNLITIFKEYVNKYIEIKESLKYLHITDPIIIINSNINNLPLKEFTPQDISLLARSDLTSVTLWISQIKEYSLFSNSEKASLLKRFALRKIMLDHFYMTSKYKEHFEKGNLVMPNYTYIPIDKTGYENENDNLCTKKIIFNIFRKTFNYAIECIIKPMNNLNLTEEEIVFLYFLILWNRNNEKYVTSDKRYIFLNQRDWALKCLSIHYWEKNISNPDIRFGEIILLLKELEWCCLLHCEDYMTSKCFNVNYLKDKWYDNICYSKINFEIFK